MTIVAWIIGLLAAGTAAVAALQLGLIPASTAPIHAYLVGRGLAGDEPKTLPWYRTLLAPLEWATRYLPHNVLEHTRVTLYWAHQAGYWRAWDGRSFLALKLAGAVVGVFLALLQGPSALVLVAGVLGWWLPGFFINGKSRRYQEAVRGELPDAVNLLAMLVQAGKSTTQALQEIGQMDSALARWIQQGLAAAAGGNPLATLRDRAVESGLADLINVFSQLVFIEGTGAGMAPLLDGLARDLATENKFNRLRKAAQVSSQIIFPVLLFYFVPYLAVILFPMAFQALGLVGGM
jgi:Flp pilus assembly protein TadB